MDNKKIDVTLEAYDVIKEYCRRHGIKTKSWASSVLVDAINRCPNPSSAPVAKKPAKRFTPEPSDPMPWVRPPFWADR